ncbi:MAG: hypothetical protein ACWA5R_10845 [bacterium]
MKANKQVLLFIVFVLWSGIAMAQDKFYAQNDDGFLDIDHTITWTDANDCSGPYQGPPNGGPGINLGDQPVDNGNKVASFSVLVFDTQSWTPSGYALVLKNRFPDDPLPNSLGKVVIEAKNFAEEMTERGGPGTDHALAGGYTEITRLNVADLFNPLGVALDSYTTPMIQDSARERYMYVRLHFEKCTDGDSDYDQLSAVSGAGNEGRAYISGASGGTIVDGSLAGSWFDNKRSGEGFLFDITTDGDGNPLLVAYFFTYKNDGSGDQLWLVAAGPIQGSEVRLNFSSTEGADFGANFDPHDVTGVPWGAITFKFTGCNSIEASYESATYGNGTFQLERVANLPLNSTGLCATP